jgi:hypothetical protein
MYRKSMGKHTYKTSVTNLVRVFDVDTETQLLEYSALCLDDLGLQCYVVLIQDHGLYRPATASRGAQLSACNTPTRVNHEHITSHKHTPAIPPVFQAAPQALPELSTSSAKLT